MTTTRPQPQPVPAMDDHLAWWYNAPRDMYTIAHHDGSTYTPWMVSVSCHQIMLIQSFGIHSAQEARLTDGQRRAARLLTLKSNPQADMKCRLRESYTFTWSCPLDVEMAFRQATATHIA